MSEPVTSEVNTPILTEPASHHSGYSHGMHTGMYMRKNWTRIAMSVVVIVAVAYVLYMFYQWATAGHDISVIQVMRHHDCKHRGGCCGSCPYASENDPRRVMAAQKRNIANIQEAVAASVEGDETLVASSIASLEAAETQMDIKSAMDGIKNTLTGIVANKQTCLDIIRQCRSTIDVLVDQYEPASRLTQAVIDAKNRTTALEAIATICAIACTTFIAQMDVYLILQRLTYLPKERQSQIDMFDAVVIDTTTNYGSIKQAADDSMAFINNCRAVGSAQNSNFVSAANGRGDLVASMAYFVNNLEDCRTTNASVIAKYNAVLLAVRPALQRMEAFNNDLPNKMDSDTVTQLIMSGDYETALIKTALEPDIEANHKIFASERSSFDSGGGVPSVRDDDTDLVPWVGIFSRPTYRRSDGSSLEMPETGNVEDGTMQLKSISSINPEDLQRNSAAGWSMQHF